MGDLIRYVVFGTSLPFRVECKFNLASERASKLKEGGLHDGEM